VEGCGVDGGRRHKARKPVKREAERKKRSEELGTNRN
jgi:hypothetical protein